MSNQNFNTEPFVTGDSTETQFQSIPRETMVRSTKVDIIARIEDACVTKETAKMVRYYPFYFCALH